MKPQPIHRRFTYNARTLKASRAFAMAAAAGVAAVFPLQAVLKVARLWSETGPWLFLAMLLTTLAVGASMGAGLFFSAVPRFNDGLRRLGQRIDVDDEGITYTDGGRSIRSAWTDITSVQRASIGSWAVGVRRIVITPGGEFDFTLAISDGLRLDRLVKERARNAVFSTAPEDDAICPTPDILGTRIHHYRTYTNRALLMCPLGFVLIAVVLGFLQATGLSDRGSPATPWVMGLGALAVWALAFQRYRTVSVRTDTLGITWTGPGRRIFIPWSDVRSARQAGSDFSTQYVIKGSQATIRVSSLISNFEALRSEIESQAALPKGA